MNQEKVEWKFILSRVPSLNLDIVGSTFKCCYKDVADQSLLGYGSQRVNQGEKCMFILIIFLKSIIAIFTQIFKTALSVKRIL